MSRRVLLKGAVAPAVLPALRLLRGKTSGRWFAKPIPEAVQPGQQAIRYGIGVGREGFGWAGIVKIGRMAEWPTWTPPAEMVARDPNARPWANGMPGGPNNPLGARALYLYEGGQDTIYRIHGTVEPWTIGLDVSSGCIRMNNDDITDLYSRVTVGAKVIVLMQGAALYKGV